MARLSVIISLLFSICLFHVNEILTANILVYLPSPLRSHGKPFERLFVELAKRGHNVTLLGWFPPAEESEPPKITFLPLGKKFVASDQGYSHLRQMNRLKNYVYVHNAVQDLSQMFFDNKNIQNLLKSEIKFDVMITELYHFDTFFALAGHYNVPIIGLSNQPLQPVYNWVIKNPMGFSYAPHMFLPYTDHMDFMQRFINFFYGIFTILFYNFISIPKYQNQIDAFMKSAIGDETNPALKIEQLSNNLSLILLESHFSIDHPRPYLPNVIEVGGIHIAPAKPLPEDIEEFMEGAENGIIYLSMGTLINPVALRDFGHKLLKIFEKLPYRIIWKWDPELLPNNTNTHILSRKWLPQVDILSHPKTKLFISHGGYHSLLEAVHAGVPTLCLPFFSDQYYNAAVIEKYKFGLKEELEASEEDLWTKIQELLNDKKYAENAKKQSGIFKDRPVDPLNHAVYWTEYVIRHKGAEHLKSAAVHLRWYEYMSLDVVVLAILVTVILLFIVKLILYYLINKISNLFSHKVKIS